MVIAGLVRKREGEKIEKEQNGEGRKEVTAKRRQRKKEDWCEY